MAKNNFISITKPQIDSKEINAVIKVLKSGNLAQGKIVEEFENSFAKFIGVKHAVAVANGTLALHLAVLSLGLKEGDEVITSPFSFIASSNCLAYVGAKPVFVDINPDDFGLDVSQIESKITKKTKAILPVHLYGLPNNMSDILKIAKKHKLFVIEDACQAHGAMYKNKKAGTIGDVGCFSFYPTKNMTSGEGGMLTTNNSKIAELARLFRNHGQSKRYYHSMLGFNFRMTEIHAAIGIEQLKKLNKFNARRITNANYLTKRLSKIPGITPPAVFKDRTHVYHQYTIKVEKPFALTRNQLAEKLHSKGIGSGTYYPVLIPEQESFNYLKFKGKTPVAKDITAKVLSLPVHPGLTKKELDTIVSAIQNAI